MVYDVSLTIKEEITGIGTDINIRLEVHQAESGLYIASNAQVSPICASGTAPRYAILEYLSCLFYSRTSQAEEQLSEQES